MKVMQVKMSEIQPTTDRNVKSATELQWDNLADKVAGTKAQLEYLAVRSGKALLLSKIALAISLAAFAFSTALLILTVVR